MKYFGILILTVLTLGSCKKYLDELSSNKLTVPSTLEDFQQLLDNYQYMNWLACTGFGDIGSDDFYLTFSGWQSLSAMVRNGYLWEKDIFQGEEGRDWANSYHAIYYCNVVLDGLSKMTVSANEMAEYNRIKGSALFMRSLYFYYLEETYGEPYLPSDNEDKLGIPLRLDPTIETKVDRSTVKQVFERIESDLTEAKSLFTSTAIGQNRPNKTLAYAFLSRFYLTKQEYALSKVYSDSCLMFYDKLVDYNDANVDARYPFNLGIDEVMLDCSGYMGDIDIWTVDSALYDMYDANDLRKTAFFRVSLNRLAFKGGYSIDSPYGFLGFATDEIYLNRAECNARLGNVDAALDDVNTLMLHRWKKENGVSLFQPYVADSDTDALQIILKERRKELLFRGMRWIDLRRLNQNPSTAVTLYREFNGQSYSLPPNSPRYTYPIPPNELAYNDLEQVER